MFVAVLALSFSFLLPCPARADDSAAMKDWERELILNERGGGSRVEFHVILFSNRYVEATIRAEADKNLWTKDEEERFKYQLLQNLKFGDCIPVRLDILNYGPTMHMAPFNKQIKLWIDGKAYDPVDSDPRFNFKLQGRRDGLIYFPRFDEKTGKSLIDGAKVVKFAIRGAVTELYKGPNYIEFAFDMKNDSAVDLAASSAMAKLEIDRLLKRVEKLKAQKADLQGQIGKIDGELATVNGRIDQLQKGKP
jgi:hypothetical protein